MPASLPLGQSSNKRTTKAGHSPVAFFSRKLTKGQRGKWTPRELGTYAVVSALRKYAGEIGLKRVILLITTTRHSKGGGESTLTHQVGPSGRRGRWHRDLAKFNVSVHYIPGSANKAADSMSRWAYPAGNSMGDVSFHGSKKDAQDAKQIQREEERRSRGSWSKRHPCSQSSVSKGVSAVTEPKPRGKRRRKKAKKGGKSKRQESQRSRWT